MFTFSTQTNRTESFALIILLALFPILLYAQQDNTEEEAERPLIIFWTIYGVTKDGKGVAPYIFPISKVNIGEYEYQQYSWEVVNQQNQRIICNMRIRREGQRIYHYVEEEAKDVLMMDYGLEVGDEFTRYDGTRMIVTSKRDTIYGVKASDFSKGGYYKHKLLELRSEDGLMEDTWIEDVGSIHTGYFFADELPDITFKEVIYTQGSGLSIRPPQLMYFSNRNTDGFKSISLDLKGVQTPQQLKFEFVEGSLHITGTISVYASLIYDFWCVVDGTDIYWYCDYGSRILNSNINLPVDIYFSGFSDGTYTIHTGWYDWGLYWYDFKPIQTVTCEGGNSQPGETAVSTPEASDTSTAPRSAGLRAAPLFDLSGRRIIGKPGRGVYIQGKRKVMVNN